MQINVLFRGGGYIKARFWLQIKDDVIYTEYGEHKSLYGVSLVFNWFKFQTVPHANQLVSQSLKKKKDFLCFCFSCSDLPYSLFFQDMDISQNFFKLIPAYFTDLKKIFAVRKYEY